MELQRQLSLPSCEWKVIFDNKLEQALIHDGKGYKLKYDKGDGKVNIRHLKGITKALSTLFWPGFMPVKNTQLIRGSNRFNNSNANNMIGGSNNNMESNNTMKRKRPGSLDAARVLGMVRGSKIHKQLHDYTQLMSFNMYGLNNDLHNQQAIKSFEIMHPVCHPSTHKILSMMRDWRWVPIRASIPVYNPDSIDSKWATEIDLIALDTNQNNLVLIEIKTGYDTNFQKGTSNMRFINNLNNSPLNQAKIQLVAASMLFNRMYSSIKTCSMYVIWCSSDGTSIERFLVSNDQYDCILNALSKHWFYEKLPPIKDKNNNNNNNNNSNKIGRKESTQPIVSNNRPSPSSPTYNNSDINKRNGYYGTNFSTSKPKTMQYRRGHIYDNSSNTNKNRLNDRYYNINTIIVDDNSDSSSSYSSDYSSGEDDYYDHNKKRQKRH